MKSSLIFLSEFKGKRILNAWAKELGISKMRLLCDFWPHGEVAKTFGVFREEDGFSERANIILDENHTVIFVKVYPIKQLPDLTEIWELLMSS